MGHTVYIGCLTECIKKMFRARKVKLGFEKMKGFFLLILSYIKTLTL